MEISVLYLVPKDFQCPNWVKSIADDPVLYQSKVDTLLRKVSSILPRIYKIEKIYSINKFAYFKRVPSFQRQTSLQILFDMTNDRQSLPHHYSSLNSNTHRNWRKQQQQNSCRYYYYIGKCLQFSNIVVLYWICVCSFKTDQW